MIKIEGIESKVYGKSVIALLFVCKSAALLKEIVY